MPRPPVDFGVQQVAVGGDGRILVVEGGHDGGVVVVGHDRAGSLHAGLITDGGDHGGAGVVRFGGHDGVDLLRGLLIVCHLISPCSLSGLRTVAWSRTAMIAWMA